MEKIIMLTGSVSMILLGLLGQRQRGKIGGFFLAGLAVVAALAALLIGIWFSAKGFYLPAALAIIPVIASVREAILGSRGEPDMGRTVGHVVTYEVCALLFLTFMLLPIRM